tara:strand:- start:287 stop:478 length:192 start_codon:yes stop_codon:yes gene_type:complete
MDRTKQQGDSMIQWSQKYYEGLPQGLHDINNKWFNMMIKFIKDDGVLYVPDLDKSFNNKGEEQ